MGIFMNYVSGKENGMHSVWPLFLETNINWGLWNVTYS
jgi:hypothetical protein